jgi:hypothetical protein
MHMKIALMSLMVAGLLGSGAGAEVIVPNDSTWKWLHPTDGKDPAEADSDFHTTFYATDFDDSKWQEGKDKPGPSGGFGYGDQDEQRGFEGVDLGTPVATEDRNPAYFRLKFKTEKPFELLKLKCQRDDGLIVFLDGKEVTRNNMPKGDEAFNLFSSETVSGDGETEVISMPFKKKLEPGEHLLAISLHNRAGPSSDLRIAEISLETATEEDFENIQEDDDLF